MSNPDHDRTTSPEEELADTPENPGPCPHCGEKSLTSQDGTPHGSPIRIRELVELFAADERAGCGAAIVATFGVVRNVVISAHGDQAHRLLTILEASGFLKTARMTDGRPFEVTG